MLISLSIVTKTCLCSIAALQANLQFIMHSRYLIEYVAYLLSKISYIRFMLYKISNRYLIYQIRFSICKNKISHILYNISFVANNILFNR